MRRHPTYQKSTLLTLAISAYGWTTEGHSRIELRELLIVKVIE